MAAIRATLKVKKGDTVQVISGKDKGAKGKVIKADPHAGRVLVEGVNRIRKHTKMQTTGGGGKTGGIITEEAPLNVSNVMVVCPHCEKAARVGSRQDVVDETTGKTRPVRVCKRCGADI